MSTLRGVVLDTGGVLPDPAADRPGTAPARAAGEDAPAGVEATGAEAHSRAHGPDVVFPGLTAVARRARGAGR
ncbi:hypothetical protein ACFCZ1_02140 [Streptomyces sp. NPDC056224]|uniref:hypothetical protein n=1 Tax=Streptomyces sp. NPDC056224 TaxID=3345750 RepID=UPI0035D94471